jgi:Ala-tRNA(Pro) deacylase
MILQKLKEALDREGVPYEVLAHRPVFGAQEVAAAQHVPGRELAKVVVARAGDRFLMAVLPAPEKLDLEKLERHLPEQRAQLATEAEFRDLFPGCEVGAMPPFGNLFGLPVYVDKRLAQDPEIVFEAGNHEQTVRLAYADFARMVRPEVDDFALTREDL